MSELIFSLDHIKMELLELYDDSEDESLIKDTHRYQVDKFNLSIYPYKDSDIIENFEIWNNITVGTTDMHLLLIYSIMSLNYGLFECIISANATNILEINENFSIDLNKFYDVYDFNTESCRKTFLYVANVLEDYLRIDYSANYNYSIAILEFLIKYPQLISHYDDFDKVLYRISAYSVPKRSILPLVQKTSEYNTIMKDIWYNHKTNVVYYALTNFYIKESVLGDVLPQEIIKIIMCHIYDLTHQKEIKDIENHHVKLLMCMYIKYMTV